MTFVESIFLDPKKILSYPTKKIDPITHDFDNENLKERIYSIYSVICADRFSDLRTDVISRLKSYKDELEFLRFVNKTNTSGEMVKAAWSELVAKKGK
jgi:hypothetical protein